MLSRPTFRLFSIHTARRIEFLLWNVDMDGILTIQLLVWIYYNVYVFKRIDLNYLSADLDSDLETNETMFR